MALAQHYAVEETNSTALVILPETTTVSLRQGLKPRASRRLCLACGARAEYYCAACGVAPYCSAECQRADWTRRHRTVCHNLARLADGVEPNDNLTDELDNSVKPNHDSANRGPRSLKQRRPQDDDDTSGNTELPERNDKRYDRNNQTSSRGRNFSPRNMNIRRPNVAQHADEAKPNPEVNRPNINRSGNDRRPNVHANRSADADTRSESRPAVCKQSEPKIQAGQGGKRSDGRAGPKNDALQNGGMQGVPPVGTEPLKARSTIRPAAKEPQQCPEKVLPPAIVSKIEILPKMYIIETLSVGDVVILSVEAEAAQCRTDQKGYVCLALTDRSEALYSKLCVDYCADCTADTDTCTPKPGELFSYKNPDEDGWYRARCLNPVTAALIDACQVAAIAPASTCRPVPQQYRDIPEFCCVLDAGDVEVGDNLLATIVAKESRESVRVELQKAETGESSGLGVIARWVPDVELPAAATAPATVTAAATATAHVTATASSGNVVVPQVPRPPLAHGARVVLVEAAALGALYVRDARADRTRAYNAALQDALLAGRSGTPLTEPPTKGQLVISKFSDGNHYRALVQRTNVSKNKYLVEYIEFGNVDTTNLENLYPCPESVDLENQPTVVSMAKISTEHPVLTEPAKEYVEMVRDNELEMILTLPNGAKTAPSGAEVTLTLEKNKECFSKKLVDMCTPGWKKLEQSGADVVDLERLMFADMQFTGVPAAGCELVVLDASGLQLGVLGGYPRGAPLARYLLDTLPEQMEEYCNSELGREPYLPAHDELCIAQCPPDDRWYRAALCEQAGGAGGSDARVCRVDHGSLAAVPVPRLRKMLPDFVRGLPALASNVLVRGFPSNPTEEMLRRAREHLQLDEEGRGRLTITNCTKIDVAYYQVDAPGLLAAME